MSHTGSYRPTNHRRRCVRTPIHKRVTGADQRSQASPGMLCPGGRRPCQRVDGTVADVANGSVGAVRGCHLCTPGDRHPVVASCSQMSSVVVGGRVSACVRHSLDDESRTDAAVHDRASHPFREFTPAALFPPWARWQRLCAHSRLRDRTTRNEPTEARSGLSPTVPSRPRETIHRGDVTHEHAP